jgi:hypothetical protein
MYIGITVPEPLNDPESTKWMFLAFEISHNGKFLPL